MITSYDYSENWIHHPFILDFEEITCLMFEFYDLINNLPTTHIIEDLDFFLNNDCMGDYSTLLDWKNVLAKVYGSEKLPDDIRGALRISGPFEQTVTMNIKTLFKTIRNRVSVLLLNSLKFSIEFLYTPCIFFRLHMPWTLKTILLSRTLWVTI